MKKEYDYDLCIYQVKLSESIQQPNDLVIKVICGKNEIMIPTTCENHYRMVISII